MRANFSLFKSSVYTLAIDPIFYLAAILTVLFCSFRFFFSGQFFIASAGSTDMGRLFQAVPYISTISVPLLIFRLRRHLFDDSLPFSPAKRQVSLVFSGFAAFFVPVFLLLSVPIFANSFGDVDAGQVASGFLGLLFYGFSASALCVFLFSLLSFSSAVPLLVSILVLAVFDFSHLLPLYFRVGDFFSRILRNFSFAWHFDSFGKGIFDSRNVFFFVFSSVFLIFLSVLVEYRRIGRRISLLPALLILLSIFFLSEGFSTLYFRADLTDSGKFSVSRTSERLCERLSSPLRLTYYRSKELQKLYPQSGDVAEYLLEFSRISPNITLSVEDADSERLSSLGVQGQQIRSSDGTKIEFVTVYSTIVLQYLEKQSVVPFVLSAEKLEYDLAQRISQIVSEDERRVLLVAGNGRSVEESYTYVSPWLSSRGFRPEIAGLDESLPSKIDSLSGRDSIVVLGSDKLTFEQSSALSRAFSRKVPSFVATSQYSVPVEDEWRVSKSRGDTLVPVLNSFGFALGNALVEDVSCFPLTMQSGEGGTAEYATVNYPLWLSLLPQRSAPDGVTVFWASPILLYNDAETVLETTAHAWLQKESDSESLPFLTNPFSIPKTAQASDAESGKFVVAATNGKLTLVSDQYFLDTLLTGFISSDSEADLRNFDFLASELLRLRGDEELAMMMEKSKKSTGLYKITDEEEFSAERKRTIFVIFVLIPILIASAFVLVTLKRHRTGGGKAL